MKVLFVSAGYVPGPMSSDKAFVRDLIRAFSADVSSAIWTINDWPRVRLVEDIGHAQVPVYTTPRAFHRLRESRDTIAAGAFVYRRHSAHGRFRQVIELASSILLRLPYLRAVVQSEKPDIVHFTDNFGPSLPLVRRAIRGVRMTCTRVGVGTGGIEALGYRAFLRVSATGCDLNICTTNACAERLVSAGVGARHVRVVPWGVRMHGLNPPDPATLARVRRRYDCRPGELLTVVSPQALTGLSQGGTGFRTTVSEAKQMAERFNMRCVVAVKPDHWDSSMLRQATRRVVIEKGPPDFENLLWAADFMFSPTYDRFRKATATPPLAWLEAMARNTALITTEGYGVGETVHDGEDGVLYRNTRELLTKLERVLQKGGSLEDMKSRARQSIVARHDIDTIAPRYEELWRSLMAGGPSVATVPGLESEGRLC